MQLRLLLAVVLASHCVIGDYESLAGHQIWKLSGAESPLPSRLMMEGLIDVMDHSGKIEHVRVAPEHKDFVHKVLEQDGVSYEVLEHDLAKHIQEKDTLERARRDVSRANSKCVRRRCPKPLTKNYMTFNQMEWYLKHVNRTLFPRVDLTSIGQSVEGRDIWLLHIKSDNASAKAIWIEGGIHAREWISPAVGFGLIQNLLEDKTARKNFEFYVAPITNPDGYVYSWTKDRMWRKNRRKNSGSSCIGVDLNRNFNYKFGVGASSNPCSEVYKGTKPFSEPETIAIRNAMSPVKDKLSMVFLLHSYGQDLLYPWGWSNTEDVPNKNKMIEVGKIFSNAAKKAHGNKYSVVNSAGGLYFASGATDDWAVQELGVPYSYTLELRDKGRNGFVLGSEEIEPSINEVWLGFRKVMDHI